MRKNQPENSIEKAKKSWEKFDCKKKKPGKFQQKHPDKNSKFEKKNKKQKEKSGKIQQKNPEKI